MTTAQITASARPDRQNPPVNTAPIETVMHRTNIAGARIVGLAAPTGNIDIASFSRTLAKVFAASGRRTVLLDVSVAASPANQEPAKWDPSAPVTAAQIVTDVDGFDRLAAVPDEKARGLFSNPDHMRRLFKDDLARYGQVVLQLPPICDAAANLPSAVGLARACDAVFLYAVAGRSTIAEVSHASEALALVEAPLIGNIIDESEIRSPGEEIASTIEKIPFLPRGLKARSGHFFRTSLLLNR